MTKFFIESPHTIFETVDGIHIGQRLRCLKRLGFYDSEPLRHVLRQRRIIPIVPYRKNHVSIQRGRLPKDRRHNAIVGSDGKWNALSLGSTILVGWIGLLSMGSKPIGL